MSYVNYVKLNRDGPGNLDPARDSADMRLAEELAEKLQRQRRQMEEYAEHRKQMRIEAEARARQSINQEQA